MTRVRHLVLPAACVLLFPAGCAERSPSGAPPSVPLQPMAPVPGPYPGSGPLEGDLSPGELGVDPIPYERFAFTERLHALAGNSPDLGVIDATERTVLVVRWFGEPPAEVRALIREFADAPFDIRVEHTRFRFGELRAEAHRLIGEHPAVVTTTFPRNEGDGVGVGINPSAAPRHPTRTTSSDWASPAGSRCPSRGRPPCPPRAWCRPADQGRSPGSVMWTRTARN